jgi:integrase
MRWKDLNLEAGVWMVPVEWAKSKREMAIPLSNEAVRILQVRRDKGQQLEWVWPSANSVTGHVVNPEDPWHKILKSAGVKEYATLHDIRRTLGSLLAMDGVAGATISKVLGHVSPQSLKHYAHLDVNAGREAIEQVLAPIVDRDKK